jgi:hypothetical protein
VEQVVDDKKVSYVRDTANYVPTRPEEAKVVFQQYFRVSQVFQGVAIDKTVKIPFREGQLKFFDIFTVYRCKPLLR